MKARLRSLPLGRVYGLLETGPVALVTTAGEPWPDVMAQSWHTVMEFEPPLVGCVFGNGYTFERLMRTKQCVNAIPTSKIARQVVGCGNVSGREVDKFSRFGLTPLAASRVKAPLVAECYANLECRLHDARLARRYGFVVLEVVKAWIDPSVKDPKTLHHRGNGRFMVAGRTIRLPSRMK